MSGLRDFARRIQRRAKRVDDQVNSAIKETALVADRELVIGTPVDTGRARSNWQLSVGHSLGAEIGPYVPGRKGSSAAENAAAAIAQAQGAVSSRKSGQDIFITNNVGYIEKLNDGWSAQAPAGFVQTAVEAARSYIRNRRIVRD